MSYQNETIGMMDEGYFVSRGQILSWLNNLLQLNLTKIEQLGSGAVYCQVIDVIHPGKIALAKVKWNAKNDYEFIGNLRILQNAFDKIGIKRYVEVQKLAKAKYQDNLEFAQWLKRYYDLNCGDRGNNYLAEERRGGANIDTGFAEKNVVPKTYNATGQIVPKKQNTPPKKKEDPPVKKVSNTIGSYKNTNITQIKSSPESKKVLKEQKTESSAQEYYKNQLRELQEKLMMIGEIIRSQDAAEMKVSLVQQLLKGSEQSL